jgi:iron complex outermembrane receptor protein
MIFFLDTKANKLIMTFLITISLFLWCVISFSQTVSPNVDNNDPASVVIIGSRFPSTADSTPIGASVITATEIRNAGIDNVNEAIRKLAGIYGRKNTRGTQDYDLDMSGFGANSANNLVILVDGVRLSESEQSVALLSSIPIDSVARIEIVRGGSSVLYGDGATGGVIQIITKQTGPTPFTGSVSAEVGQFYDRMGAVSLTRGWDQVNLSLNLSDQLSDNYRMNNDLNQQNANGALTWYFGEGRVGLRIDSSHQKFGLPGALTLAQFNQDPRLSLTPLDNGSVALDRYTAFFEQQLGKWQVAAELSTRKRTTKANFVSMQSNVTYSGWQTQFTPRLRYADNFGDMQNELVVGLDLMNWNRQTDSNFSLDYATQKSSAIYFRDEMTFEKARFAFGARHEVVDKSSVDPFKGANDNYDIVQGVNAWELQGSYAFSPVINLFTKVGQSYRVANVDDNSFTEVPNTPLLPQLSHDLELGAELGDINQQLILRLFRHQLTNEIFFDPLANNGFGANSNLDPTRRQGVAVDIKYRWSQQWRFSAQAQHVQAVFTEGANEGKELVLVPKNTISAHINWVPGDGQKAYVGAQWVSTQRYGNDFTNTCSTLIPSYVTFDARYARTFGDWEWSVSGSNLLNKQYFSNAFGCRSGIYPDDGRQLKVALRYDF